MDDDHDDAEDFNHEQDPSLSKDERIEAQKAAWFSRVSFCI